MNILSAKQIMTIIFYMSVVVAIVNVSHLLILGSFGVSILPYTIPTTIQDDEVRAVLSVVYVGVTYGILTHIRKNKKD